MYENLHLLHQTFSAALLAVSISSSIGRNGGGEVLAGALAALSAAEAENVASESNIGSSE